MMSAPSASTKVANLEIPSRGKFGDSVLRPRKGDVVGGIARLNYTVTSVGILIQITRPQQFCEI